jgi:DNA-binding MarR family transcriptional regulator
MTTPAPALSTQVIGQAESALGAILDPLLKEAKMTFSQWLVLVITSASGGSASRDQLVRRITTGRKVPESDVLGAVDDLVLAGAAEVLPGAVATVRLTPAGQERVRQVRGQVDEITSRLFDLPAEDLATAGRVLTIVTERANAEIARARS